MKVFINPRQKCPNCYSDQFIRSVRPTTIDALFWSDYEPTILVKCLQCDEIIHTFREKKQEKKNDIHDIFK